MRILWGREAKARFKGFRGPTAKRTITFYGVSFGMLFIGICVGKCEEDSIEQHMHDMDSVI